MRLAKRVTIQVSVCDEFEGCTVERSVRLTVAAPMGMDSDVGSLATEQTLERQGDGSGSSVWTHDEEERRRCNDELETGATVVNAMVISDPRLPFGDVKRSGYGRELARLGIRKFVDVESVSITEQPEAAPAIASNAVPAHMNAAELDARLPDRLRREREAER